MRLAEHFTALRALYEQCLPGRSKLDVLRPGVEGVRRSDEGYGGGNVMICPVGRYRI